MRSMNAPVVIVAGNVMDGSSRQIKTPRLSIARVRADMGGTGKRTDQLLFSASAADFARQHLHTPSDIDSTEWNRAFLITVKSINPTTDEVWAYVRPVLVHRSVDLRMEGLASAIYSALDDGKPNHVGKIVTNRALERVMKARSRSGKGADRDRRATN